MVVVALMYISSQYIIVFTCIPEYVNMYVGTLGGQKKILAPLQLELQVAWVLGTDFWSSVKETKALNH